MAHYHVGVYKENRLVNASGFTYRAERAAEWAEQQAYAEVVAHEEFLSDMYRRAVSDEFVEEYSDREPCDLFPTYTYRPLRCSLWPTDCTATYEAICERRRARA